MNVRGAMVSIISTLSSLLAAALGVAFMWCGAHADIMAVASVSGAVLMALSLGSFLLIWRTAEAGDLLPVPHD